EMKVLEAAQKAEREKFKALKDEYEKDFADSKTALDTANTQLVGLRAEVENEKKKNSDLEKKAQQEKTNNEAATNQIDALGRERDQMKDQITERNTRILKLEKDIVTATNNETQATILAGKLRDQNQSLMMQ